MSPAERSGVGGVASTLLHPLLAGPAVPAQVLATGPMAVTLDAGGDLLVLTAPGAVRLPIAVEVASLPEPGPAPLAVVGDHGVRLGGWRCRVSRWFDPTIRVGPIDGDGHARARLDDHLADVGALDPLLPDAASSDLARGLLGDPTDAVALLVGRGGGTTPSGDDLVAGALAALRATNHPAAERLGDAVRRVRRRTTTLSGALLAAADRAAVVPELADLLRALAGDDDPVPAADRLLAVGHRSGWHLAAGLAVAAHACAGAVEVP